MLAGPEAQTAQCAHCTHAQREPAIHSADIHLRVAPDECDLIDRAARILGKSRSEFLLEAARERAQDVLLEHPIFRLDANAFERFIAALEAPPAQSPGIERLLAVKTPWTNPPA